MSIPTSRLSDTQIRIRNRWLFNKRGSDEVRLCECGCGAAFKRFSCRGVERMFKPGHNARRHNADQ